MKRVGLALGGGFIRGAAHVGVLKVLEAEGIKPAVAGISAGSIVAALYAAGRKVPEIQTTLLSLEPGDVLDGGPLFGLINLWRLVGSLLRRVGGRERPGAPLGLLPGARLLAFLRLLLGDRRFGDLDVPLVVTATDVVCGRRVVFAPAPLVRGEFVRLARTPVVKAVRASCAVSGFFEPVRRDGMVLVDGGVREGVPAEAVRLAGVNVVVAVDLGERPEICRPVKDIVDLLGEAWDLALSEGTRKEMERHADFVIRPALEGIRPWDFHRIPQCIKAGEQAACIALNRIREVLA
ncbi:MAG: patatin-like phospholipase family protein [Desulfotomaculales bacterium]